jgi:hypothetical protein
MARPVRQTLLASALVLGAAPVVSAQQSYPNVKITGRLQEQFYFFDNEAYASTVGPKSNFFVRRARIEAKVDIAENVSAFLQPSFEGGRNLSATTTCQPVTIPAGGGTVTPNCRTTGRGGIRLRDAWIDLRLSPASSKSAAFFRGGQEKRPFSRYELTSSVNLPSIERGAGAGLPGKASNNLFDDAGFLAHDVGVSFRVEHKLDDARLVTLKVGAYNGQGEIVNDANNGKSFGARATVGVWSKLDVGASFYTHDAILSAVGAVPADSSFRNTAFDVDAQWGKVGDRGLWLLAEYDQGDAFAAGKPTMRGIQGLAAYNIRMIGPAAFVHAVEPAFRIDLADPNTDADDDRVTTITGVLGLYFSSRAILRVGYERQSFQAAAPSVQGVRSSFQVSF